MCRKITVNSLLPSISSNCYHRYIFKNIFNSMKSFKQNKKLKHTKFASMIFGTNTNKNDLVFIFRFFLPYCSININYLWKSASNFVFMIFHQSFLNWYRFDIVSVFTSTHVSYFIYKIKFPLLQTFSTWQGSPTFQIITYLWMGRGGGEIRGSNPTTRWQHCLKRNIYC